MEAIIESTCIRTVDHWGDYAVDMLMANPVFDILRTAAGNALVLFNDGRHRVFLIDDVDEYFHRSSSSNSAPPPLSHSGMREIINVPSDYDFDDALSSSSAQPSVPSTLMSRAP